MTPSPPPPPTNNQTNNKKQKQQKSKQQHTQHQQPQQTNKQPQQTKQQISTKTDNPNEKKSERKKKKKNPLHVQLIPLYCVLCSMLMLIGSPLFILWFSFCSFLFNLLLWVRQTKRGLNGEKTSNARRNKTKTNPSASATIAQSHSLTVNSLQLDDSTVPL